MSWRIRSVLWALLLIGAGVLLLLKQTNDRYAHVSVWPLLLVVIGLWFAVERLSVGDGRGFAVPMVLVGVGVFYLLRETGHIDAHVSLWPVLLIALGAAVLLSMLPGGRRARPTSEAIVLDGARQARIEVQHGGGELRVGAGSDPKLLLQGTFGGPVEARAERRGDRVDLRIRPRRPRGGWPRRGLDWSIGLARGVALDLDVETGADAVVMHLQELLVPELRFQTGASRTDITLPASGATRVRLQAGAARVRIRVPQGVAARVRMRGSASSVNVDPARFRGSDGTFESADYGSNPNRADVEIDAGAADVTVA